MLSGVVVPDATAVYLTADGWRMRPVDIGTLVSTFNDLLGHN